MPNICIYNSLNPAKEFLVLLTISAVSFVMPSIASTDSDNKKTISPIGIVIHGGAGVIDKSKMSDEKEKAYHAKLEEALNTGYKILKAGGSSLDAVEATIIIMEDSPLFNAGKGAVYTHDETHELDASIMDGNTLKAGAVAGVTTIQNPIKLARAVMEKSNHVMLAGKGAEDFAKFINMPQVENSYFDTEERLQNLRDIKKKNPESFKLSTADTYLENILDSAITDHKFGTVGAVALDQNGNLAAATSTGGMTNKRFGRIGDAPVIGAGTYADNQSCAVSATGHGEYFIRSVVSYDICAIKRYKNLSLDKAAKTVIQEKLVQLGGDGGIIAMDTEGNIVMEFNTKGMFRGYINNKGERWTGIYNQ